MSAQELAHVTVLLHEAVDALAVKPDGVYVDGTFGRGGHSRLILSKLGANGRLVVFDKDPQAIAVARQLAETDKRVQVVHGGFSSFQVALLYKPTAQLLSETFQHLNTEYRKLIQLVQHEQLGIMFFFKPFFKFFQ